MAKILVLYYSSYGHIESMANAIAEGAQGVSGTTVAIRRVPETVSSEIAVSAHFKVDQAAPVATVDELVEYDAIIIGTGTRYGRMTSQMAAFWDKTGPLWLQGKFAGKIGAAFTSTASQHGGQETTLMAIHTSFFHLGMIVIGLSPTYQAMLTVDEIAGGSPYGATTMAGGQGQRQPSEIELNGARFQGRQVAELAAKVFP